MDPPPIRACVKEHLRVDLHVAFAVAKGAGNGIRVKIEAIESIRNASELRTEWSCV